MSLQDNEFLIVRPSVRLTPHIIPVIEAFDPWFKKANLKANVTSGQRSSGDQLVTIQRYAIRYDVDREFPEILSAEPEQKISGGEYAWQKAWSRLLNIGVIINPPYPAKVLFDYWRNGINKKGNLIGHSPHYYGYAFDIGGGNTDHDISDELRVVKEIYESKTVSGFKGYLPERKNNCVHIDCYPVKSS